MPDYIEAPVVTDEDQLQQDAFDFLRDAYPDWSPAEGNLESFIVAGVARLLAENRDVASDVPPAIFRYLGGTVLGIPAVDATSATVDGTVTMQDNAGYTLPAGTLVDIPDAEGTPTAFEVSADVVVAAGTTTGPVSLTATDTGAATSGLGGVGVNVSLIDPLDYVDSIVLSGVTTGGVDAESDDAYQDRLAARLTLLTPRPILPRDFELLAKDLAVQNGVTIRAMALDGYNPADSTSGNERMIAVAVIDDSSGANVSGGVKTAIDTGLQEMREVNFVVNVIDPTRTTVDVTFTAVALPGAVAAAVEAAAEAAVTEYLSPANWGQPASGEERRWVNTTAVRRLEIAAVINAVEGLDYIETLTIGLNGGTQDATEVHNITGAAPIAEPGAINGTVS